MRLCRDLTTNFHERFCNFTSSNNISLKCKKSSNWIELEQFLSSITFRAESCYRVSLLPICLCSDVLTNKSRRQNNTESKDSLKCWPPVSGVCGHGQEASNGAEKWGIGNYSRCNEFESNFATTLHWIIWEWAAMRDICSERESLFGMHSLMSDDEACVPGLMSQGSPPWPGQGPAVEIICRRT